MVILSSSASFVASTRLIRPGVGANDSPDQSRQGFEQYDTSEVLENVFHSVFCKIAYTSLENTKNENFMTTSHQKVD